MYKKRINLVIFYIVYHLLWFTFNIYAQEYQITNVPVSVYSIDRFTNEIYYQNEITGEVFRTNFTGTYHILTEFTSVPQFAHNSHIAVYVDINQPASDLYLKDFENDTSFFLGSFSIPISLLYFPILFSPSDDKILFTGETDVDIIYYSFLDSSFHEPGIKIFTEDMEWLTDTTIISRFAIYNIQKINIIDKSIDTIIVAAETVTIRGLAYNKDLNALAYSLEYNSGENSSVNLYYLNSGIDSTVYDFLNDGPSLGGFTIIIRSLIWGINRNKLGFIGEVVLNPFSFIYAFDLSSSKTYQYSNWDNSDGIKYNLQWLNTDTVIYSDYTDGRYLFGLNVVNPVSVFENPHEFINELDIKVYPNPFNGSTKFLIYAPSVGDLTIDIFNNLGENIGRKNFENVSEGKVIVNWNEIQDVKNIATGIYFVKTSFVGSEYSYYKTIKVVYLK